MNQGDTIYTGVPDIGRLKSDYESTISDLSEWLEQQDRNFNTRFCKWSDQSADSRKHNKAAFPWRGASDQRIPVVDESIRTQVALMMTALAKSRIIANPVEGSDLKRASVVSEFLQWLIKSHIKEFFTEAEIAGNHLLEKGLMAQGNFFRQKKQQTLLNISISDLAEIDPEYTELLIDSQDITPLVGDFQTAVKTLLGINITKPQARKHLKDIKEEGQANIVHTALVENRPYVKSYIPGVELIWPPGTTCIQDAPFVFLVEELTAEQLMQRVISDGYDREYIEDLIEHGRTGMSETNERSTQQNFETARNDEDSQRDTDKPYKLVTAFRRLFDEKDQAPGIYITVFSPDIGTPEGQDGKFAIHELLGYAHGMYPFTARKLELYSADLYETRGYPEMGEGWQNQYKTEVDGAIDRSSMTTLPPLFHPPGKAPGQWGPGVRIPKRAHEQIEYAPLPSYDRVTIEVRQEIEKMTNKYFGRNGDGIDPAETLVKQQHLLNAFLSGIAQSIDQLFTLWQQFGPDEISFRVTGQAGMESFQAIPGERFDFNITFDAIANDTEKYMEILKAFLDLQQRDTSGKIDNGELLQLIGEALNPNIAARVMRPEEGGRTQAIMEEMDDIAKISAGNNLDVPENDNHQVKLEYLVNWMQQPDVQAKLQNDPAFAQRIQIRVQQRQFQLQQRQNAEIGRIGGEPMADQLQQQQTQPQPV